MFNYLRQFFCIHQESKPMMEKRYTKYVVYSVCKKCGRENIYCAGGYHFCRLAKKYVLNELG